MHYLVVGVNAVGKSTLLRAVSERTGIPVLHATTELVRYLGMGLDYDKLRGMDQDFTMKAWEAAAAELAQRYADKPYLLDGHILNLTEGKIIPRVGKWVGLQDALVMLKAKPETILRRLNADTSRNRDLFPSNFNEQHKLAVLEDHQQQMEQLFKQQAVQFNLPSRIIMIESLESATAEFEQFIRETNH